MRKNECTSMCFVAIMKPNIGWSQTWNWPKYRISRT